MVENTKTIRPSKEQLELIELNKRYKLINTKLRLQQEGIDIDLLSQQMLDKIIRLNDEIVDIEYDGRVKFQKIQQDGNARSQKIQQDANTKIAEIQKRYQEFIGSIKSGQPEKVIEVEEPQILQPIKMSCDEEGNFISYETILNNLTDTMMNSIKVPLEDSLKESLENFVMRDFKILNNIRKDYDKLLKEKQEEKTNISE